MTFTLVNIITWGDVVVAVLVLMLWIKLRKK